MARPPLAPCPANFYQSLNERLRWLRQNQKPYMTQQQLSDLSKVSLSFIQSVEKGHIDHMSTGTLKKLAAALGCTVTIRLMRVSDRAIMDSQPSGPPIPFAPKRTGKISAEARARALSRERSPWLERPQPKRKKSRKSSA